MKTEEFERKIERQLANESLTHCGWMCNSWARLPMQQRQPNKDSKQSKLSAPTSLVTDDPAPLFPLLLLLLQLLLLLPPRFPSLQAGCQARDFVA